MIHFLQGGRCSNQGMEGKKLLTDSSQFQPEEYDAIKQNLGKAGPNYSLQLRRALFGRLRFEQNLAAQQNGSLGGVFQPTAADAARNRPISTRFALAKKQDDTEIAGSGGLIGLAHRWPCSSCRIW